MNFKTCILALTIFFAGTSFSLTHYGAPYDLVRSDEVSRFYIDTVDIYPKDDNNDTTLKTRYRIWYYATIDQLPTDKKSVIRINGDGWRGNEYVVPVFSYDNEHWRRFPDTCVIDSNGEMGLYNYEIHYQFDQPNIYIARTIPYPPSKIEKLIQKHEGSEFFNYEIIGKSQEERPLYLFTITDPFTENNEKEAIWIHARVHPGEAQSSHVLEGIINYLMKSAYNRQSKLDLSKVCFYIVPIVNIDGVVAGNARRTPNGEDLEREWIRKEGFNRLLADSMAIETRQIVHKINQLIDSGKRFSIALNIHGKNGKIDDCPFLYSNFKKANKGHGKAGNRLFKKHLHFAQIVSTNACDSFFVRMSYNPQIAMQNKTFAESWWWANFRDSVMAATVEIPDSKRNCSGQRMLEADYHALGSALAIACYEYALFYNSPETDKNFKNLSLDSLMNFYKYMWWEK